jgi:hypothetical protein
MDPEQVQSFWSEVGSTKTFTDPFFIEQFTANVPIDGLVVEYGCGYGRILNLLWENGFTTYSALTSHLKCSNEEEPPIPTCASIR